jgi:PAS domain S-box-containing protein
MSQRRRPCEIKARARHRPPNEAKSMTDNTRNTVRNCNNLQRSIQHSGKGVGDPGPSDIPAEKYTEAQSQWELTFNAIPDPVMILDLNHRIVKLNTAMVKALRKQPQEMVGKACYEVMHESEAPISCCPHSQLLIDGREHYSEVYDEKMGGMFRVSVSPLHDAEGRLIGSVHVARDITALKKAEQVLREAGKELERRVEERTAELRAANEKLRLQIREREETEKALRLSEERFRAICDSAEDLIYVKNLDRRYTHANPAMERFIGLPSTRIVGLRAEDIYGEQAAKHIREVDERVLSGDCVEEEHTRPVKGVEYTFHDILTPLRDSSGLIIGICGMSRDITDRRHVIQPMIPSHTDFPSESMKKTLEAARLAATTDSLVLLTGESGTGKDYLARYVHDHSERAGGPFFSLNCAGVPLELAESELFGHERGAFTGAGVRSRGLLELAEGGTLLLNEIGELSLQLQAKLLTFLETKAFTRLGGRKPIKVNARIIAATNRDLQEEVSKGHFRLDLFHRLNVIWIKVPPLRQRSEDISILAQRILGLLKVEMQLQRSPELDRATLEKLREYSWPGNVRELRNFLERSIIMSGGRRIDSAHLNTTDACLEGPCWTVAFPPTASLNEIVGKLRLDMALESLRRTGGNQRAAADLLGITRYSLRRLLQNAEVDERFRTIDEQ